MADEWQPIATAPTDGTPLLLFVVASDGDDTNDNPTEDDDGWRTIGWNNCDNDGEDVWQMAGWCWSHDHFTEGRGRPTHWMPLPKPPSTP